MHIHLKKLIFLVLPLITWAAIGFGQTLICGKVKDQFGRPLSGCVIEVGQNTDEVNKSNVISDSSGFYSIELKEGSYKLKYQFDEYVPVFKDLKVENGEKELLLRDIFIDIKELEGFTVLGTKKEGIATLPTIDLTRQVSRVEQYLILTTAASSRNELTSSYNVRGGNYDENLVYVNGFLINRPFLTRSGQQEGMSFIQSALVGNIAFSAGGFQANYGDKLSSVLDISYRKPDSLKLSLVTSLLSTEGHFEKGFGARFRILGGARYRSNGYFLNALPAKGNYNPIYWDGQFLSEFDITEKWKWNVLGHLSSNNYQFAPQTQKTEFGTVNEAFAFNIYFEGQEKTRFLTGTIGTSLGYQSNRFKSTSYLSYFGSNERERFDVLGQYFINELETDPAKEAFGDSVKTLGVGSFLNHARNELKAQVFGLYNDSEFNLGKARVFKFGMSIYADQFEDKIREWRYNDSAGYSIPQGNLSEVEMYERIVGDLSLKNLRSSLYSSLSKTWSNEEYFYDSIAKKERGRGGKWELNVGIRGTYTTFNAEGMITPRVTLNYLPIKYSRKNDRRRYIRYRFALGTYYQPPLYREFRTFDGGINPEVRAQKSAHAVVGLDYQFYMLKREKPFKFSVDAYYKYLWDINPYEIENVRIRYYADNNAVGYATGLDAQLNGEFIPGIQSFFKLGLLTTKEDIKNDFYYSYFNAAGEKIEIGVTKDIKAVDSTIVYPGFVRRPTDQHVTVGVLFQDNMPGYEQFGVQLGLNYGTRIPYGPPDFTRYKDTLRMRSYFRVDLGFSYDLLHKKLKNGIQSKHFEQALVSIEVYNALGVNNVLSMQWIRDVSGKFYAIPNPLSQRLFNLKLSLRIK